MTTLMGPMPGRLRDEQRHGVDEPPVRSSRRRPSSLDQAPRSRADARPPPHAATTTEVTAAAVALTAPAAGAPSAPAVAAPGAGGGPATKSTFIFIFSNLSRKAGSPQNASYKTTVKKNCNWIYWTTLHTHLHPPPLVLGMAFLSRLTVQAGVS